MISISTTFTCAAGRDPVFNSFSFWMLVWAIAIDDDRQRCEKERRRKRAQAQKQHEPKPPRPPGPGFCAEQDIGRFETRFSPGPQ